MAGIGTTDYSARSGRSELALACEASRAALDDAGLTVADVDGVVRCDMDAVLHNDLATALGIPDMSYFGAAGPGGTAPCLMLAQAVGAIVSGQASTVLMYRSLNGRSGRRVGGAVGGVPDVSNEPLQVGGRSTYDEYFAPYGLMTPPQFYALVTRRHMIEYGTTVEQLGAVATTCRARGLANARAQMRRRLTLDDYLASPMVADPLRLNDCCLETDGACAVVVTSTERASDLRRPPVLITAVAAGSGPRPQGGVFFPSLLREDVLATSSPYVAKTLYERAGIGPGDVDVAQLYDCFTISVVLQLADYGFCKPGDAGPFAASGAIDINGELPINTGGGHLSEGYLHGLNHVVEGVRQLRGESSSTVPGAATCLVTSGPPGATSAALLRKA